MGIRENTKTTLFQTPNRKQVLVVEENGEECVATTWEDGTPVVFRIYNPNDEFWTKCREDLADLPYLNLEQAISEGRDERV